MARVAIPMDFCAFPTKRVHLWTLLRYTLGATHNETPMIEARDRRAAPRTAWPERPIAWVRGMREVRLLDLSLTGAQIEHLDLLRPGASCDLDLPPHLGACNLPVQVVWCTVITRKRVPGGDSRLVARSGLRFNTLTIAQHATLLRALGASPERHHLARPVP